jgi:hypothetical protein
LFPEEQFTETDALTRRKAWIERSVIPAMRKVLAAEPEYLQVFLQILDNPLSEGVQSE